MEDTIRALSGPGLLFKEMGFKYFGPVDGHDTGTLISAFDNIRGIKGPVLLHVVTKKGKGYIYAEEEVTKFHGISRFNIENGEKSFLIWKVALRRFRKAFLLFSRK